MNTLYSHKSSQQEKPDKRSSEVMENPLVKNQTKVEYSELNLEMNELTSEKNPVTNYMDKVYLGEGNGYMERHNFYEISKNYMLYIINLCTNRNKNV